MNTKLVFLGKQINVASQSRRRWLLALVYAGFALLAISFVTFYRSYPILIAVLLGWMFLSKLLGGRYYEGGIISSAGQGDERDLRRRDHAYFVAYWWWDLTLFPALLAVGLKNNPFYPAWNPALRTFVDRLPYELLIAAVILYYTLPQAILLWTEPDMKRTEASQPITATLARLPSRTTIRAGNPPMASPGPRHLAVQLHRLLRDLAIRFSSACRQPHRHQQLRQPDLIRVPAPPHPASATATSSRSSAVSFC